MDELEELTGDYDEYEKIEEGLYEAIFDGKLKYIYHIYESERSHDLDTIVVSLIELNENKLYALKEIATLYDYGFNIEKDEDVEEVVNKVINGLIRK
jgi:hypothetical protein